MALRYGLTENLLTSDPNDYMAVPTDNQSVGINELIDHMISRGSTITKAEALGVYEELGQAITYFLKSGANINTDLFTIYPAIAGIFNSSTEAFNPKKHTIKLNMRVGSRLKEISSSIILERVDISASKPVIEVVTDLKTSAINNTLTIGQMISVKGSLLKISEAVPEAGIFIIGEGTPETRVTQIIKNKPSELMFFMPGSIKPGACTIEIRTILSGRRTLLTSRSPFNLTAIS